MARSKDIQLPPSYYSSGELLGHLQAEVERTGHDLSQAQEAVFHSLRHNPDERLISLLHSWWNYDLDKLLAKFDPWHPPKPRISVELEINRPGTLSVWWYPTTPKFGLEESDFRERPYLEHFKENRLLQVRSFYAVTVHHRRPVSEPSSPAHHPFVSPNRIVADAILLRAATEKFRELTARLAHCFKVTLVDDIYTDWIPEPGRQWNSNVLRYWEIKNVAEHEREIGLKLLEGFEKEQGISLSKFIEVAFAPDKKARTGPPPQAHTKIDRTGRRFKTLGYPKLTPSIVRKYVELLRRYRSELLPENERPPSNVVQFEPKR